MTSNIGETRHATGLPLLLPVLPSTVVVGRMEPWATAILQRFRASHRLIASPESVRSRGFHDTTLLLADDRSFGFVDAINSGDSGTERRAVSSRAWREAAVEVPSVLVPAAKRAPDSRRVARAPVRVLRASRRPRLRRRFATTKRESYAWDLCASRSRRALVRGSLNSATGTENAATSIGLLRDAVAPMPPASPRDYIAAYTHPLPAGTFNRSYVCDSFARQATYYCEYDAPDLPAGGGRFLKQFSIAQGKVTVRETLAPRDKNSTAQLVSVSGRTGLF